MRSSSASPYSRTVELPAGAWLWPRDGSSQAFGAFGSRIYARPVKLRFRARAAERGGPRRCTGTVIDSDERLSFGTGTDSDARESSENAGG